MRHQTARPSDRPADAASATFPATVTPKPGDTVRLRLDYEAVVDKDGCVRVPKTTALNLGAFIPVARPDALADCWTVEVVTPPMEEPTALGTVVVDADGDCAVYVGWGEWQVIGGVQVQWAALPQPVRLATEEERG